MKFTLSWLKKHLEINLTYSSQDLHKKLDQLGLEVEDWADGSKKYKNFIIAEVVAAEPHPNADSLRVCKVNTGTETLTIVCGAPNARAGIKVVLAQIGATIPNGSFAIKKSKIRGVESEGMMCSAEELDLLDDVRFASKEDDIIELEGDASLGMGFADYAELNDIIIEVALTPNRRKDCASLYGIARELAAAGFGQLKQPEKRDVKDQGKPQIRVQIDTPEQCSQFNYFTAKKEDLIKETTSVGRTADGHDNTLVELSNFMMFDLGNPNHIYDLDKIAGDTLYVRLSKAGEAFISLQGKTHILPEKILVIADAEKILCVAGVMGGELSKVDENTKNIVVEVANFNPESVALAGQTLGITSDSRFRFEGGIDHGSLDEFTNQIRSNFHKASEIQKAYGLQSNFVKKIDVSLRAVEGVLGIPVAKDEVRNILEKLAFEPNEIAEGVFEVIIPSWKQGNIESHHDVVDELLRMGLIDKINSDEANRRLIRSSDVKSNMMETIESNSSENLFNPRIINDSTGAQLRKNLLSRGMNEVLTWSFYSISDEQDFSIESNHLSNYCISIKGKSEGDELIKITNPINSNFTHMRRSIIPHLVATLCKNPNNKEKSFSIFEIGNLYGKNLDAMQTISVAGLCAGNLFKSNLHNKNRSFSFFDVREDLLSLLKIFKMSDEITDYSFDSEVPHYYHPSKSIRVMLGKTVLGICGELHPSIIQNLEISHPSVAIFELFTHNIPEKGYRIHQSKPFIRNNYQRIRRDLAFIVENDVKVGDLIKTVKGLREKLIDKVEVFDLYKGIEGDKKSIALSFELQPNDSNVTDDIIKSVMDRITQAIKKKIMESCATDNMTIEIRRSNMVRNQIRAIGVENQGLTNAMLEIPRQEFLAKKVSSVAYSDAELPMLDDDERLMARPEMLAKLLAAAEITSKDSVLEIGCGTGYGTAIISRLAKQVVGIDPCKKVINKAKKIIADLGIVNSDFHHHDFRKPFPISDFSIIIVNGVVLSKDHGGLQDKTKAFDLKSRALLDKLLQDFDRKVVCVEGVNKYAPMHVVIYQKGVKQMPDEIYLPELILTT